MIELESLVRRNIWKLTPYSCARDEFKGRAASVFLDANENPYGSPLEPYTLTPAKQVKVNYLLI